MSHHITDKTPAMRRSYYLPDQSRVKIRAHLRKSKSECWRSLGIGRIWPPLPKSRCRDTRPNDQDCSPQPGREKKRKEKKMQKGWKRGKKISIYEGKQERSGGTEVEMNKWKKNEWKKESQKRGNKKRKKGIAINRAKINKLKKRQTLRSDGDNSLTENYDTWLTCTYANCLSVHTCEAANDVLCIHGHYLENWNKK